MLSPAELTALAEMDQDLVEAVAARNTAMATINMAMEVMLKVPSAWVKQMVIQQMRNYVAKDNGSTAPVSRAIVNKEVTFATRDGVELRLYITKLAEAASPGPLIVLFHGGGFIMGIPENMSGQARQFVENFGAVCVAPQYRLAPEHAFPTAHQDAYDALRWISTHAAELGADISKAFVVGGQSAGGSLSAVLSHQWRDEGLSPPITGVYVAAAALLPPERLPEEFSSRYISRTQKECLDDPVSPPSMRKLFTESYKADCQSPLSAPLVWPTGHQSLPRTYVQVCGRDRNRDEDILYEEVLQKAGVPTRIDIYKGLPHVGWIAFPKLQMTAKWMQDTVEGMRWLLRLEGNAHL